MNRALLSMMWLLGCGSLSAQTVPDTLPLIQDGRTDGHDTLFEGDDDYILGPIQEQPEYPGGLAAIGEVLSVNLRYPDREFELGTDVRVLVTFIISSEGNVDSAWVKEPGVKLLDDEAIRLALLLDGWNPGKLKGRPVNCTYNMPVTFHSDPDGDGKKNRRSGRKRAR
jgi:TonB family protein